MWVPDHARVLGVPVPSAPHIGLHHTHTRLRCSHTLHKAATTQHTTAKSAARHTSVSMHEALNLTNTTAPQSGLLLLLLLLLPPHL
jgi:hypothetical protein